MLWNGIKFKNKHVKNVVVGIDVVQERLDVLVWLVVCKNEKFPIIVLDFWCWRHTFSLKCFRYEGTKVVFRCYEMVSWLKLNMRKPVMVEQIWTRKVDWASFGGWMDLGITFNLSGTSGRCEYESKIFVGFGIVEVWGEVGSIWPIQQYILYPFLKHQ